MRPRKRTTGREVKRLQRDGQDAETDERQRDEGVEERDMIGHLKREGERDR